VNPTINAVNVINAVNDRDWFIIFDLNQGTKSTVPANIKYRLRSLSNSVRLHQEAGRCRFHPSWNNTWKWQWWYL